MSKKELYYCGSNCPGWTTYHNERIHSMTSTPADSPADLELDKWLKKFGTDVLFNVGMSGNHGWLYGESSVTLREEAKAQLEAWKQRAVVAAEMRGLSLVENAPRVPVELMSMVLERKAQLTAQPGTGGDNNE